MIEQSLVYIHATGPTKRFVGCGTLIEGGYVATCRHVLRMAVGDSRPAAGKLTLEIEYPHSFRSDSTVRSSAELADECETTRGPAPDLVLLLPDEIPTETMTLQLAREDKFESGNGFALIGLAGRDRRNPDAPNDVRIDGKIADNRNSRGLRQFTGINDISYWSGRGSSGSPAFLEHGQQLAGILCKSELGANEGDSSLREAFVIPATTIRPFLVDLTTRRAAHAQHIPVDQLQPILQVVGIQDISIAEIPVRIRQFVEAARARADEPVRSSNDGTDIESVIGASREKLAKLDTLGARGVLQAKIDEEQEIRTRRLVPLLKERATLERLTFDHESAKATLIDVLRLSPSEIWAQIELGDIWRATGNLENATAAYRAGERAANDLHDHRGLSLSLNRIGGVLFSKADRSGAITAYRAALAVAEKLSNSDPTNAEWQRELSVSHNRIGDVLVSQGDRDEAIKAYRASLAIAETLVRRDSAKVQWQRDLSICHDRIGNVLMSQGDREGALAAYRSALTIRNSLTYGDPANAQRQRDVSVSHNKIGDVLESLEDFSGALVEYRAALDSRIAIAGRDPANAQWQRDLSVSYSRVGDVLAHQKDNQQALAAYRASLGIAETLVRRDPANTEWQRDLSVGHQKIGDLLNSQGDSEGALAACRASLTIAKTLVEQDSANTDWQRDLSSSYQKLGDVLNSQGDRDGALAQYRASLATTETLAQRDPTNVDWQRDLMVSCVAIAEVDPGVALPHFSRALDIARKLQSEGRLAPKDLWMIDDLTKKIDAAGGAKGG